MASPYPQVVLFGDSLIEGSAGVDRGFCLMAQLQIHCIRRYDVVNRGFSGWNTANAIDYLSQIFPMPTEASAKMTHLFILLGANDAVIPGPTTSQHVPIVQYKENLVKIISHPHVQAHKAKIFLVTPPPLDEIKTMHLDKDAGSPPTRLAAVSAAYSEKVREVAREHPGVVLIDIWKAIMDKAIEMTPDDYQQGGPWLGTVENGKQGGLADLLPDGLHMSGDGYRVFWKAIKDCIQVPEKPVFPDWSELNPLPSKP